MDETARETQILKWAEEIEMGKHPSGYRISRQPDKPIDELNPFITENHPRLAAVAPLTLQPAPREVIPPADAELEQEKDKKND